MIFRKIGKLNLEGAVLLIPLAITSFASAMFFHHNHKKPQLTVSKQVSAVNMNALFLKMISLGNKRLIADSLWIQTLIESDLEAYKGDPFNNWMFLRFNNIAELDPRFYENYYFGGQYLSIIKDDIEGSIEITGKGLKIFPHDYKLNFNQGFNHYFEKDQTEKALGHLEKIENHPDAPRFISSLIIKLRHKISQDSLSTLIMLKETYDRVSDPLLKQKLAKDIYALKAEMDLGCLNSGGQGCDKNDAHGNPYVRKNGVYEASLQFTPYKIFKRAP